VALILALAGVTAPRPVSAQALAPTRVRLDSLAVLTQLAREGYEVAGVTSVAGSLYATVVATPAQQQSMSLLGFQVVAVPAPAPAAAVQFRSYDAVLGVLDSLAQAGAAALDTLGMSWEGRPIVAAKVGPPDDAADRANVLFLGGHHAREWISVEMALRLLTYFAAVGVPNDRDVWVIPVVNPDGYAHSFESERFWRKNRRPNSDGSYGVDLNRNYPAFWGSDDTGSSPTTVAETYRGPGPGSEPETQAVMAFHARHPPTVAVSYHSYSNLVLFPYAHAPGTLAPDQAEFRAAAGTPVAPVIRDHLLSAARATYYPGPAWQLYPTNGDYTEWAYRAHGTLAFTVELTAGCCVGSAAYGFEFPDDSAAVATVFEDNLPFAMAALEAPGPRVPSEISWESLWPEARLVAPADARPMATVRGPGPPQVLVLATDSLDRGADAWRWRGPLPRPATGTRIDLGMGGRSVELVYAAGAEADDGWTGWTRERGQAMEGAWAWRGASDTLGSPVISLAGVEHPRLAFWARHEGSLFLPERFATVEISVDDGLTWSPVARLEGAATSWYPVVVELPAVPQVRLHIVASDMLTRVDAIRVFGDVASLALAADSAGVGVSENPVRSSRVFFSWTAGTGDARLSVFTLAGLLVHRASVSAADGLVAWDLTDVDGRPVRNGAYAVVLEIGGEVLRKRLFVARSP